MIEKHKIKRILFFTIIIFLSLFLLLNISAFIHAYKFTHFTRQDSTKTKDPEYLDLLDKLIVLFTGISNPKPQNNVKPHYPYTDLIIKKNDNSILHCWFSQQLNPKGIVLLAHGFSTSKFSLIKEASAFNSMNYDSLLIDLSGHGDSDGNSTSIGYYEADDVYKVFTYIKSNYSYKSIILYGVSMGAVTILHSIYKYKIIPDTIILECPFSGLLSTVKHRFEIMGLPPSPFSELLVFWGSIQNRFN